MNSWRVILTKPDMTEEVLGSSHYKTVAEKVYTDEMGKRFVGQLELLDPDDVICMRVVKK